MKNAILLHGSSCTPDSYWLPKIKQYLEKHAYSVWVPQLPNPEAPNLDTQLSFILKDGIFTAETIIISHSSGCPLILAILETINTRIHKAVLVAGYARRLGKMSESDLKQLETATEPILRSEYDWEKIRDSVRDILFINSDDDPWGCDDQEGYFMFKHLGGTLIIRHGEGHMGSEKFNQPYKEFPLLEKLLDID